MYLLELAGEDDAFASREAATACTDVTVLAPGLATARGLTGRVRGLAYTHRASDLVGTCAPDVESAVALLEAASIDRTGTVSVRARDVRATAGVDARAAERRLGRVLVERGFAVDLDDPDHELRACFSETAALGWLAAESVRDFGTRQPTDKPFFQPGSMDPLLARAVANLAGARPGRRLLDPMCGTGGGLVETGLVGADVLGVDVQAKMARGARENLARYLRGTAPVGVPAGEFAVLRGDATRLPLRADAVDGVLFDAPYGRQSKVANESLDALVAGALAETRRLAPRGVLVADRDWTASAEAAGWRVPARFERRVHRSLTRHVHLLA
ncbi:MAG: methyltransferase domain-containing protein [Haloarculaceae archaeon]